ncbi:MAG: SprT-like domain-containing protein [Myxococcota bacterium]|nr:SprT-like domain-containing protein [Myxococcota bacterium]
MQSSSLKQKTLPDDELRGHVSRFYDAAGDALRSDDPAEGWNAAFTYAKEHALSSRVMTRVLSVLRKEHGVAAEILADWMREGSEALGEAITPDQADTLTNRGIEANAVSVSWEHGALIRELYSWADRFNQAFFRGDLPPPVIAIQHARRRALGTYLPARDGYGLRFRIVLNTRYLSRPWADVLRTLLHEIVHQWEDVEHGRRRGGPYHTKTFRDKALALGIPTDERGVSLDVLAEGAFIRLLREHAVPLNEIVLKPVATLKTSPRASTLQKWTCACYTNIWTARGTNLQARCEDCGELCVRTR